jgi:DNA polymerase III subunit gamma/tau
MQIESLAVKYRPQVFSDLIGQEHIVTQLEGMFKKQRMPNAIMLTGLSGTGKTTLSRMIARYINCKKLETSSKGRLVPCGKCQNCLTDNALNYSEVDAADARGIDDTRALVAASRASSLGGGTRIYCIDEAHQLTSQAQQLLLKPLEKPSINTLWIIGTMSHEKLLPAIVGRCTRLDTKQPSLEQMVKFLTKICKKEEVEVDKIPGKESTLKLISELSNLQPRAALAMLDSILFAVASGSKLDSKELLTQILKNSDMDLEKASAKLLQAALSQDIESLVKIVKSSAAPRGLMHKTKWLLVNVLENKLNIAKYKGYGTRLFETIISKEGTKVTIKGLVTVQKLLAESELRMNQGLDEEVALTSGLLVL